MLHGSMTMHEMKWNLSLALGYNLEADWWELQGIQVVSIGFKPRQAPDRLRE